MGILKESVRVAVQRRNTVHDSETEANRICRRMEAECRANIGKQVVWRTRNNHELKAPQLVRIVDAYPYHVVLEKTAYALDGAEHRIRFSVSYFSMHCGLDTFSELGNFGI